MRESKTGPNSSLPAPFSRPDIGVGELHGLLVDREGEEQVRVQMVCLRGHSAKSTVGVFQNNYAGWKKGEFTQEDRSCIDLRLRFRET